MLVLAARQEGASTPRIRTPIRKGFNPVQQPDATGLKWSSLLALACMVAGLVWMIARGELLARSISGIAVQAFAVLLMIAARVAFGIRSFHPGANPTAGDLVTHGPYRYLRHPIYASILYFAWAAALDHGSPQAVAAACMLKRHCWAACIPVMRPTARGPRE
jgi:protein-S-isoprenylcysteine O-methyltransferase Ste14